MIAEPDPRGDRQGSRPATGGASNQDRRLASAAQADGADLTGWAHGNHDLAVAGATAPLIAMGADLLKAVSFINGGAAAATLFCVAQFAQDLRPLAHSLVIPLSAFGFGLAVAAFAIGWSYLAQAGLSRTLALRRKIGREPFVEDTEASRAAARRGELFRRLAFAAVLVAMASSVGGFALAGALLWIGLG